MRTVRYQLLGYLALAGLVTACEPPQVEVSFAQPFPAGAPNLTAFRTRDQGTFDVAADSGATLQLGAQTLVREWWLEHRATARQLDSLGLPARAGLVVRADGQRYRLQALAGGVFKLEEEQRDTVLCLGGPQAPIVRRYGGWYYVSTPRSDSPGWEVQRLAVVGTKLNYQFFNPDSLRLRALDPGTVQLRREHGRLLYTLTPGTGRATRQVSRYGGLWLDELDYDRLVVGRLIL